jgi:4-hydroxymandelate oxidase
MEPLNLFDFEAAAAELLPPMARDYYASGALDEITLRRNRAAWDRFELHYRVLVDVAERDLATTVLDQRIALPVLLAPTAFHRLAHPDGELATVRAAGAAGTIMTLSTLSNVAVEDVTREASGPVWFQLYVYRDRGATAALVRRVEEAGCGALVLTVDAPLLGRRERDVRNRFRLPPELKVANLLPEGYAELPADAADSGLAAYAVRMLDPSLAWRDLEWLAGLTRLPLVIKGIVRPDDAARAAEHGAAAIVVSNHGGRQLDGAPATAAVLPAVAEELARRGSPIEVLVDGGVRRGTDVIKAIALGARAVLIGRPVLWGLAVGGAEGATRVLAILRDELDLAMALCGCRRVADIGRDLVQLERLAAEIE